MYKFKFYKKLSNRYKIKKCFRPNGGNFSVNNSDYNNCQSQN